MRARLLTAALLSVVAIAVPGSEAVACGCGSQKEPVVAQGASPGGVSWEIKLGGNRHLAVIDFTYRSSTQSGGWGSAAPLPLRKGFVFNADTGSDLGPANESDISGFTERRVTTLTIQMTDGSTINVAPQPAAIRLGKRFRWARKLRIFDEFFPSNLVPAKAIAYNAAGQVLTERTSNRGLF
jgi:hypothetical protein